MRLPINPAHPLLPEKKRAVPRIPPFLRPIAFTAIALSMMALVPPAARSEDAPTPLSPRAQTRRILVLCSYGAALPAYQKITPAMLSAVQKANRSPDEVFFEYLDLWHLPDVRQKQALAEALQQKYQPLGIDLIVALQSPAMGFLLKEAKAFFPDIPVIAWDVREAFKQDLTARWIIPTSASLDMQGTLQLALELFPKTRRVVFVVGVSQIDQYDEREARQAFSGWTDRLTVEYTSDASVEEVLRRVAHLPLHSIVIYGNVFMDRTGRMFTPREVGERVAENANVPVFALYDTLLDLGVVGGSLLSFEAEGARLGRLAVDVLRGGAGRSAPSTPQKNNPVPMFDWQQIERWGARTDALPQQSLFINRPPSLWERYRWQLAVVLVLIAVQGCLISMLLLAQRRKRQVLDQEIQRCETVERSLREATEQLDQRSRELEAILASVQDYVYIIDHSGRFVFANKKLLDLWGLSDEQAVGKTMHDLHYPDPVEAMLLDGVHRVYQTGDVVTNITHYTSPTGVTGYYENVLSPMRDPAGRVAAVAGSSRDITGRKRAEEALRRISQFPEENPNPVFRVLADATVLYENLAARKLRAVLKWHGDGPMPDAFRSALDQAVEQGNVAETEILTEDGKHFGFFAVQPQGEDYINFYGMDITQRKIAEAKLRTSYERSALLAAVAQRLLGAENPQVIVDDLCRMVMAHIDCQYFFNYLVDVPGQRMALNAFAGIPADAAETIRGLDFGVAVCGCAARDKQRIIAEHIDTSDDIRTQLVKSFGAQAYCCHPLLIEGELLGTLSFGTRTRPAFTGDEISLMQAVADHVALAMQRRMTTKALRESEARIRASLNEKEVLLKEIHHRVKNNMQVISSLVDLQADEITDETMRGILKDVIFRVRSMAMVHEKLYQSIDFSRVDFADYVNSLLGYLWRAQGSAIPGVALKMDLEPVLLPVNEAVPCGLMLNELFTNALKHAFAGREKGEVAVSLKSDGQGNVVLAVRDDGVGLPPPVDITNARSLGLRLVQMLARQLHAVVAVQSEHGTTFTIAFEIPQSSVTSRP